MTVQKNNPDYKNRIYRKLGYFDYQAGLITRHLGQGDRWKLHLKNSRNFILKAVEIVRPEKVTIVGSGWLLDVPLAELSQLCREVVLADIVHPPDVKKQASVFPNVVISETDITGGLPEAVWEFAGKSTIINRIKSLVGLKVPEFSFKSDPGLLISLNILSQIDVLPVRYIEKTCRVDAREILDFRMNIQNLHLKLLGQHKAVLITDYEEHFTDNKGREATERSVVSLLPAGRMREDWIWDFDLQGSDYYTKRSVNRVAAILI